MAANDPIQTMRDHALVCGFIKNKPNITETVLMYRTGLKVAALIHAIAEQKYTAYSWYNDPDNCDSTIRDNINAIYRHFTAYSMGFGLDEDGLPHVFHMCCRAGMLVSTAYRRWLDCTPAYSPIEKRDPVERHWGFYITPYEVYSLTKTRLKEKGKQLQNAPIDELCNFIHTSLLRIMESDVDTFFNAEHTPSFRNLKTLYCYDYLYYAAILLAQRVFDDMPELPLNNEKLYDESTRKLIVRYFPEFDNYDRTIFDQ